MGLRLFVSVPLLIFYFICVLRIGSVKSGFTICDMPGCNCSKRVTYWEYVNCTFSDDQKIDLSPGMVHNQILEVFIHGGNSLSFLSKSVYSRPLSLIKIYGTKKLTIASKAFYNVTPSSLLIQIDNCDQVTIETGSFDNMQSFLEIEINNIKSMTIGKTAFSKLSSSKLKNIGELDLTENAFEFKNQGLMHGRHGPVTTLYFENVVIPIIPEATFYTSLASIKMVNCQIGEVDGQAFRANEISDVSLKNTRIHALNNGAFTNKTLITNFEINNCSIKTISNEAILSAFVNFSVHHSFITEIEEDAIKIVAIQVDILANEIGYFHSKGFRCEKWNQIVFNDNIITFIYPNFINIAQNDQTKSFSFKGNDIQNVENNALSFINGINSDVLYLDDNFFNHSCSCTIEEWLESVTNNSALIEVLADSSFCIVNKLLSDCFSLPIGIINIKNFTELSCQNKSVECKPYRGENRVVNTSSKIFFNDERNPNTWIILILCVTGCIVVLVIGTFIVFLIRGGRWLKRKGYFRNIHYNQNENSVDDENTMVTTDYNETLQIPDELTVEFLQLLSQKLDDPSTHQQASEMIERLYEMFVVDDNYENNARHEEAHLYEELGNIPPPPYEEEKPQNTNTDDARSILNLLEEKFNLQTDDEANKPSLKGEYSEPSDAAVHLYSELKQNKLDQKSNSIKSNLDSMISRPLPCKPADDYFTEPGPSSLNIQK